MTLWLAVALSLVAATSIAVATALQHRAATFVGTAAGSTVRMFRFLFRRVDWWAGVALSAVGMALRAAALGFGSVAVVQSVLVVAVVLGVVLRGRMDRRSPTSAELAAVVTTSVGVALLATLVTLSGNPGGLVVGRATLGGVALLAAALVAWVGALRVARRRPRLGAYLFSVGAGACFGLTAGMLKAVTLVAATGPLELLASPVLYLFAVGASLGAVLTHHAYRLAPLSVSMPTVNVVNLVGAMLFAWTAFGEAPATGLVSGAAELVALAVVTVGLVLTGRAVTPTEPVITPVPTSPRPVVAEVPPAVAAA